MQLINSDQQCISTSDPVNKQWKQTLALEKAQDEIELLREQVSFLQEFLSEQLRQQQAVEQELELMNAENQHLVEAKLLFLEEIKEFARTLPADGGTSKKALTRLLSKFYDEIAPPEELESVRSTLSSKEYAA